MKNDLSTMQVYNPPILLLESDFEALAEEVKQLSPSPLKLVYLDPMKRILDTLTVTADPKTVKRNKNPIPQRRQTLNVEFCPFLEPATKEYDPPVSYQ